MNKISFWTGACLMSFALGSCQQPPKGHPELNDSNTALHLLVPQHVIPYKEWNKEEIKASLDQILSYLETATPMRVAAQGELRGSSMAISVWQATNGELLIRAC